MSQLNLKTEMNAYFTSNVGKTIKHIMKRNLIKEAYDERFLCQSLRCEIYVSNCLGRQEKNGRGIYADNVGRNSGLFHECRECSQGQELLNKWKGVTIMSKKGTCSNCERDNLTLVASDRCWTCYDAGRGKKGKELEKSLKEVRERIQSGINFRQRKGTMAEKTISQRLPAGRKKATATAASIPAEKHDGETATVVLTYDNSLIPGSVELAHFDHRPIVTITITAPIENKVFADILKAAFPTA